VKNQCPTARLFRFTAADHENLHGALGALISQENLFPEGKVLGVEVDSMILGTFRSLTQSLTESGVEMKECEGVTRELRECKDSEEIELLQKAASIADTALAKALEKFQPGLTENDLKAELEYQILRAGGSGTSFSTIVASGPNGSLPHAGASHRVVKDGELVTIDFGAVYQGYCSDMTRTIWYGKLPERSREILAHTRRAQELALQAVKAGVVACQVDKVARDYLVRQNLGEYFLHSLGHGIGLEVHEAPGLRKSNEDLLRSGQVITVEPGVYIPGDTGCRVEDTVVVTATGCRILNRYPKQSLDEKHPSTTLVPNPTVPH
jgi:Xaa-Pro aminopeptidase